MNRIGERYVQRIIGTDTHLRLHPGRRQKGESQ
jgi:hypothetical protein